MEVTSVVDGDKITIEVSGKVTVATAPQLKAAIVQIPGDIKNIDFELENTEYVSSAGLRVLVTAAKLAMSRGGSIRLLHPNDDIVEVLRMTNLGNILAVVQ